MRRINGTKTIDPLPRDITVAEIVDMLTPSERDAMVGKFSFQTLVEQETSEARLRGLGLWKRTKLRYGESHLTSLGEQVKQHIRKLART